MILSFQCDIVCSKVSSHLRYQVPACSTSCPQEGVKPGNEAGVKCVLLAGIVYYDNYEILAKAAGFVEMF